LKVLRGALHGQPHELAILHKWLTILWLVAAIPICLFLSQSVPFLVFISVYAVVAAHWGAYQAACAETRVDS
jgi:hypothetical protein